MSADEDPLSEASLRAAALRYLARYAASSGQVARVLRRRALRNGEASAAAAEEVDARIARVVAGLERAGLLNDADYAAMKAESLLRRGASNRWIAAALRDKGISDDLAAQALDALDAVHGAAREERAALRYARRRGLGPWARPERRAERRLRDIAAMVRAGFPMAVATWAVDLDRAAAEAALAEER